MPDELRTLLNLCEIALSSPHAHNVGEHCLPCATRDKVRLYLNKAAEPTSDFGNG